jgi:hypothetical protein
LRNSSTSELMGLWNGHTTNADIQYDISSEKRHIQRGNLNVYVDFLVIKTKKFIYNGKEISNKFNTNIELLALDNGKTFTGTYKDPISENNVKIVVTLLNSKELLFSSTLPEIDFSNKPANGTIFSKEIKFLRE